MNKVEFTLDTDQSQRLNKNSSEASDTSSSSYDDQLQQQDGNYYAEEIKRINDENKEAVTDKWAHLFYHNNNNTKSNRHESSPQQLLSLPPKTHTSSPLAKKMSLLGQLNDILLNNLSDMKLNEVQKESNEEKDEMVSSLKIPLQDANVEKKSSAVVDQPPPPVPKMIKKAKTVPKKLNEETPREKLSSVSSSLLTEKKTAPVAPASGAVRKTVVRKVLTNPSASAMNGSSQQTETDPKAKRRTSMIITPSSKTATATATTPAIASSATKLTKSTSRGSVSTSTKKKTEDVANAEVEPNAEIDNIDQSLKNFESLFKKYNTSVVKKSSSSNNDQEAPKEEKVAKKKATEASPTITVIRKTSTKTKPPPSAQKTNIFDIVEDEDFSRNVLNNRKPVIVEFYSAYCGPCKMMEPIVERLVKSYDGRADIVKVNIDYSYVPFQHNVNSVPTLISFRNGREIERIVGLNNEQKLNQFIRTAVETY